jgi:hypothetical protein
VNKIGSWFRTNSTTVIPFVFIASTVCLVAFLSLSVKYNKIKHTTKLDFSISTLFDRTIPLFAGCIIGVLICLFVIKKSQYSLRAFLGVTQEFTKGKSFWIPGLLCLFGFFISVSIRYFKDVEGNQSAIPDDQIFQKVITDDPGGLFTIIIGVLTIYGLWLNVQSLWEIKRSINTFAELIDRVNVMAKTVKNSKNDKLCMMVYTPALGCLSEMDGESNDLIESLKALTVPNRSSTQIEIVCLKETELKKWHRKFINRKTYKGKLEEKDAESADTEAKGILDDIRIADPLKTNVHEVSFDRIPGFYLFFTKTSAIIVTPLFLPIPGDGINSRLQEELPPVQMMGLETQDRLIINQVTQFYKLYLEANP